MLLVGVCMYLRYAVTIDLVIVIAVLFLGEDRVCLWRRGNVMYPPCMTECSLGWGSDLDRCLVEAVS